MTLYLAYLLGVIEHYHDSDPLIAWATAEIDTELREHGYLNCGDCPFDGRCNMNHRGTCAANVRAV